MKQTLKSTNFTDKSPLTVPMIEPSVNGKFVMF